MLLKRAWKVRGSSFADVIENQVIDLEDEALRAALAGQELEHGVVGGDFADG